MAIAIMLTLKNFVSSTCNLCTTFYFQNGLFFEHSTVKDNNGALQKQNPLDDIAIILAHSGSISYY